MAKSAAKVIKSKKSEAPVVEEQKAPVIETKVETPEVKSSFVIPAGWVCRDENDQPITDLDKLVEFVRDGYAIGHNGDRATHLKRDEALAVLFSVPGDDKDTDIWDARLEALENAEPKVLDDISQSGTTMVLDADSTPLYKLAVATGQQLDHPEFIDGVVKPLEAAGDTIKQGPGDIMFGMFRWFNRDEQLDEKGNVIGYGPLEPVDLGNPATWQKAMKRIGKMPLPGNQPEGDNRQYEKFKIRVVINNEVKYPPKWFYQEIFNQMGEHGRKVAQMIDDLKEKGGNISVLKNTETAKGDRSKYNGWRTNIVGKMKTAKKMVDIILAIQELPHNHNVLTGKPHLFVGVYRKIDKETNLPTQQLRDTDTFLYVEDASGARVGYKPSELIKLRPQEMVKNKLSLTVGNLAGTVIPRKRRGTTETGPAANAAQQVQAPAKPSVDVVESQLAMLGHMLTHKDEQGWRDRFDKRLREDKDLRLTCGDIYIELSTYFDKSSGALRPQYNDDIEERSEKMKKEDRERKERDKTQTGNMPSKAPPKEAA